MNQNYENMDKFEKEYFIILKKKMENILKNQISNIFERITIKNKKIASLDLSNFDLELVPSEISNFSNLCKLNLNNNFLENLPESLQNLQDIKELELQNNMIDNIWKIILRLQNLRTLILRNNQIESIPFDIKTIKKLEILDVAQNYIEIFPDTICELNNLNQLDLSHNYISKLPNNFQSLKKLTKMDLSNNKFKEIPSSLFQLPNLYELNLSANYLKTLPAEIGTENNLQFFIIRNNPLIDIPNSIQNLSKIKYIDFRGVDLTQISSIVKTWLEKLDNNLSIIRGWNPIKNETIKEIFFYDYESKDSLDEGISFPSKKVFVQKIISLFKEKPRIYSLKTEQGRNLDFFIGGKFAHLRYYTNEGTNSLISIDNSLQNLVCTFYNENGESNEISSPYLINFHQAIKEILFFFETSYPSDSFNWELQ